MAATRGGLGRPRRHHHRRRSGEREREDGEPFEREQGLYGEDGDQGPVFLVPLGQEIPRFEREVRDPERERAPEKQVSRGEGRGGDE